MEREIVINDKKLIDALNKRAPLIEQGREISRQIDALEKERNKLALQAQKLTDRITKILEDTVYSQVQEFEFISAVGLKDGNAFVTIYNHLESIKQELLKRWRTEMRKEE